jgi:hypothetical protein
MLCAVFTVVILTGSAQAFYVDSDKTLEVSGKAQTRASFRTDSTSGFTYPEVPAGNLVQHRNLLLLEVTHDLKNLTNTVDLLYPFRALDLKVKYHLVGRFMYEGVYDYGPQVFQDVQDADKENIENFKQSYKLWECYADISRGPLFFRIGKQNLSWGETDVFRLLDSINPLDNTYGGPFEDLDDRRIPLLMLRGSYNFGTVGPVSSVSLESFWVPGFWEAHVAPWAPFGTPYAVPLPKDMVRFLRFSYPGKKIENSRWGVRLMGLLGSNLSVAVGHYRSYLDMPSLKAVIDQKLLTRIRDTYLLADLNAMQLEASFPQVNITGASMNYWQQAIDAVIRAEVAWFWDEPVFIPRENLKPLYGPILPLPPQIMQLAGQFFGIVVQSMGLTGIPLNPQSGEIPTKQSLKYMIGFDKQIWIRPLNRTNTFFLSFQYFGQTWPDYDKEMRQPLSLYPKATDFSGLRKTEQTFTGLVNTMYLNGRLSPQMVVAYDVRGAWLVQPSINYIWEPFRFMIQWSSIDGNFTNFGAFRDRDQITFIFTYLLN